MAAWDVFVDGFSLNSLGYGVSSISGFRGLGPRTAQTVDLAGIHGVTALPSHFGELNYTIEMWVDSVDPTTGLVLTSMDSHLHANFSYLNRVFAAPFSMDVQVTDADGVVWHALSRVTGTSTPEVLSDTAYKITLVMAAPAGMWSVAGATTQAFTTFNSTQLLDNLGIGNAPVCDTMLQVKGPITNPEFRCPQPVGVWRAGWAGSLTANQWLQIDCANWTAKILSGAWSPSTGTVDTRTVYADVVGSLSYSSPNGSAHFLEIWPLRPSGNYRVACNGTGTTVGSIWYATSSAKRF